MYFWEFHVFEQSFQVLQFLKFRYLWKLNPSLILVTIFEVHYRIPKTHYLQRIDILTNCNFKMPLFFGFPAKWVSEISYVHSCFYFTISSFRGTCFETVLQYHQHILMNSVPYGTEISRKNMRRFNRKYIARWSLQLWKNTTNKMNSLFCNFYKFSSPIF